MGPWQQTAAYFSAHVDKKVKIKSHGSWNAVDAVIESRNAVVHGLGRFTARQVRKGVPKRVSPHPTNLKFEVSPDFDRVVVTHAAVRETSALLRDYIVWLDGVLAPFP